MPHASLKSSLLWPPRSMPQSYRLIGSRTQHLHRLQLASVVSGLSQSVPLESFMTVSVDPNLSSTIFGLLYKHISLSHARGKTKHVLHVAVLCCAVLCCAVLCCAVLCCAVLCCAVLCCAVLCCAVLCCAVLCCAVLCCLGPSDPGTRRPHTLGIAGGGGASKGGCEGELRKGASSKTLRSPPSRPLRRVSDSTRSETGSRCEVDLKNVKTSCCLYHGRKISDTCLKRRI